MLSFARRALFAATLLAPLAGRAEAVTEINFGVVATEGTQNLRSQWAPFFEDMQKAVGITVTGYYPSDYAGVIEAMRFNKVHCRV